MTYLQLDRDSSNLADIAPDTGTEQERVEVHRVPIVSNSIQMRKLHQKYGLDDTFAVACYDLGPLALESKF